MEKHIYFVRHGESDSNVDGIVRGQDAVLTEKGRAQADIVAKRVRNIEINALVSSPFPRTMETAEAISKESTIPIEQSDLFAERRRPSMGMGQNWKGEQMRELELAVFDGYASENHRHSDEENFEDLRTRANKALDFLAAHPKDKICVVTHGVFLRVLLCAAISGPEFTGKNLQSFIRSADTENTGISHFILQDDRFSKTPRKQWIIRNWNDSAHLG